MGIMDGDILSHRARKNELAARQMQQVTEHNGERELWFTIGFSVGGVNDIPLPWQGVTHVEALRSFKIWLFTVEDPEVDGTIPWHTIELMVDGSTSEFTFRGDWVAGFHIGKEGRLRA